MKRNSILLAILFFFTTNAFSQSIATGVVIDTVMMDVEDQSYALYLPPGYSDAKKYPVIFFYDPSAQGTRPLSMYLEVAEKYEIIMACSNNSRNYVVNQSNIDVAGMVISDVLSKYSIDEELVITSGFSGGSRVAMSTAIVTEVVTGAIGIGAVVPSRSSLQLRDKNIPYAGIVGNQDFNFIEHYEMEKKFREEGIKTIRLVGNHPHWWADLNEFEVAFLWMVATIKGKDYNGWLKPSIINEYLTHLSDSVSTMDAWRIRNHFAKEFDMELQDVEMDESSAKKVIKKLESTIAKEKEVKAKVRDSLRLALSLPPQRQLNSPMVWLISEGQSQKRKLKSSQKKGRMIEANMHGRLLGTTRAAGYEASMGAINRKDFDAALVGIEIWSSLIENEQWEFWWKCKIYSTMGDVKEGARYLDKLIKIGFKNGEAIAAEATFDVLKDTDPYKMLTQSSN